MSMMSSPAAGAERNGAPQQPPLSRRVTRLQARPNPFEALVPLMRDPG
eukprot:CAMPEP_0118976702 /NCGR_PEP_ID=MMETSP1173-20130426/19500_1 /TAXON_ID=1034831 /ORGANISM="Rhizochromulina marina cf, Strain CCMP1243" /LENGTH=47 /DNA_ID= /DNA_START= /DNA_END= /DNA_ORIENTATION=